MIESCSKKRMLAGVICLGGITVVVLIFESSWAMSESGSLTPLANMSSNATLSANDPCWMKENHSIVKQCHPCTKLEIASSSKKACIPTHFKETVHCNKSNVSIERSCDKVIDLEEKKFWQFEVGCLICALVSATVVLSRQKTLDRRYLRKLRCQAAASV